MISMKRIRVSERLRIRLLAYLTGGLRGAEQDQALLYRTVIKVRHGGRRGWRSTWLLEILGWFIMVVVIRLESGIIRLEGVVVRLD